MSSTAAVFITSGFEGHVFMRAESIDYDLATFPSGCVSHVSAVPSNASNIRAEKKRQKDAKKEQGRHLIIVLRL